MIRRFGSWCIGRYAGRNYAIPACAPMRQMRTASAATTAHWIGWTPLNVRRRAYSSGALSI